MLKTEKRPPSLSVYKPQRTNGIGLHQHFRIAGISELMLWNVSGDNCSSSALCNCSVVGAAKVRSISGSKMGSGL